MPDNCAGGGGALLPGTEKPHSKARVPNNRNEQKPLVKRMSSMMQWRELTKCLLPVFICSNFRSASRLAVALRKQAELGQ